MKRSRDICRQILRFDYFLQQLNERDQQFLLEEYEGVFQGKLRRRQKVGGAHGINGRMDKEIQMLQKKKRKT